MADETITPARTQHVVEVPVHSPGWSTFFLTIAVATLLVGGWFTYGAPAFTQKRAEQDARETCDQEQALKRARAPAPGIPGWPQLDDPSVLSSGSACWSALEKARKLESTSSTNNRTQNFTNGMLPAFAFFVLLARRLRTRCTLDNLGKDRRKPVLYLRAFSADATRGPNQLRTRDGEEQALVRELERVGPVIAIGKPGAKLAAFGASRLFVRGGDWQSLVTKLLESAQFVVVRGANTPGVRWELAQIRQTLSSEKLALWFPSPLKQTDYAALRSYARDQLDMQLPESSPLGFVVFDPSWRAMPLMHRLHVLDPLAEFARNTPPDSPTVLDSLAKVGVEVAAPPPFRVHGVSLALSALWLVAMFAVPGSRWSFLLAQIFQVPGSWFGPLVEALTVLFVALGLAFFFYARAPSRRVLPSLVLCAVLFLDGAWIIARAEPRPEDVVTSLCEMAAAGVPEAERREAFSKCFDGEMRDLPRYDDGRRETARAIKGAMDQCSTEAREQQPLCAAIQMLLWAVIPSEKPLLQRLMCQARSEHVSSSTEQARNATPKADELLRTLRVILRSPNVPEELLLALVGYAQTSAPDCAD